MAAGPRSRGARHETSASRAELSASIWVSAETPGFIVTIRFSGSTADAARVGPGRTRRTSGMRARTTRTHARNSAPQEAGAASRDRARAKTRDLDCYIGRQRGFEIASMRDSISAPNGAEDWQLLDEQMLARPENHTPSTRPRVPNTTSYRASNTISAVEAPKRRRATRYSLGGPSARRARCALVVGNLSRGWIVSPILLAQTSAFRGAGTAIARDRRGGCEHRAWRVWIAGGHGETLMVND